MKIFIAMLGLAVLLGIVSVMALAGGAEDEAPASRPATFRGSVIDESGKLVGPVDLTRVTKPEADWLAQLTPQQYRIVRKAGTERPGSGALLGNKADGVYGCVACGLPLFAADGKFESGTGWPSFFRSIAAGNVEEHADSTFGMVRTEITCARCSGHLGHVFDDGPPPTGLRDCVNSESLSFTPTADLPTLADSAATMIKKTEITTNTESGPRAVAVLAGGCFWCVEAVLEELDGVFEVVSGYVGDTKETANYREVCSGQTKHAEAVRVHYDPSVIAFEDLLRVHFATHDPTQFNRQGNDVGPQYRSAIFYSSDEEKALAKAVIDELTEQKIFRKPIVTTLEPLSEFYVAETVHQNYVCSNPGNGYVRFIAMPKVEKVRKQFKDKLKDESPLNAR